MIELERKRDWYKNIFGAIGPWRAKLISKQTLKNRDKQTVNNKYLLLSSYNQENDKFHF